MKLTASKLIKTGASVGNLRKIHEIQQLRIFK